MSRAMEIPPGGRLMTTKGSADGLGRIERMLDRYRVTRGKKFRLGEFDPGDTGDLGSDRKPAARELLAHGIAWLSEEQEKLYAQDRRAVLLVFQAMDAAGKDSTIRHVMSGVNPQGCQVFSFKQPSMEELDHDYLWRYHDRLPERGRIGIFNRSYYEEVLVVRVHPELLERQRIPGQKITEGAWKRRLDEIASFERYLGRQGTTILKFFLNVSRKEQRNRFLERLDEPEKNWKFSPTDVAERGHWDAYMAAYEDAIRRTASDEAPWYVVPADHKWFTRLVVAAAIVRALREMRLSYPKVEADRKKELDAARRALMSEKK
jgi:PPK2 family polyphosphate:nucleotide phosphotransferase